MSTAAELCGGTGWRWARNVVGTAVVATALACGGPRPQSGDGRDRAKGDDADLAVSLAEVLIEAGAHQNAVPMLRTALARDPDDPRLHYLMGTVLRDRGVYAQARAEFETALRLALKRPMPLAPVHSGLGILHDLQGQHEAAARAHAEAVRLQTDVARYHNNKGFSHYLAGDPEAAISAFEDGLRIDPSSARIYVNMGFALAAVGREDDALRSFRQTMTEAGALNNLALARELRGDAEAARRYYREALLVDPGLKAAETNLRAMDNKRGGTDDPPPGSAEETP